MQMHDFVRNEDVHMGAYLKMMYLANLSSLTKRKRDTQWKESIGSRRRKEQMKELFLPTIS